MAEDGILGFLGEPNILQLLIILFMPGYIILFTLFNPKKKVSVADFSDWKDIPLFDRVLWSIIISISLNFLLISFIILSNQASGTPKIELVGPSSLLIFTSIFISIIGVFVNWTPKLNSISEYLNEVIPFKRWVNEIVDHIKKVEKNQDMFVYHKDGKIFDLRWLAISLLKILALFAVIPYIAMIIGFMYVFVLFSVVLANVFNEAITEFPNLLSQYF
ncbi:MAG: hypothetical protein ABIJ10_02660 [Candidatus Micrarchaeota archaeon]|nr:hypothetical protein [Candidatus Micrarchaeota archaeon]